MAKNKGSFLTRQREKLRVQRERKNRFQEILDNLQGNESSDALMFRLFEAVPEGPRIPEPGNYYFFIYNATKPGDYDEHPLIACTELFEWGFKGINFHWGTVRTYVWQGLGTGLYQVQSTELDILQQIPFEKFKTRS